MPFILRRLGFYAVAAWAALTINFFLPRAMPGNAVEAIMSKFPNLTPTAYRALEAMLGVGHPGSLWHQYVTYLNDVVHFNFGTDVSQYPSTVSQLLGETIPWTLLLVGTATVIAFVVGTLLGIFSGWRSGGSLDRALPGLMFLQAIPYFFLALVLVWVLGVHLHIFPIGQGYAGGLVPGWHWSFITSAIYHSLLPAFTIVITSIAGWMLQMRNVMITTIGEDYVLAAPGQGPVEPARHLQLRGPQRVPAAAAGLRPRPRLRRLRRHHHGDRLFLSRHRAAAAERGAVQRLPAHAGDLPRDHLRRPDRQPDRRPRHRRRRSARPDERGSLMTTALPISHRADRALPRRPASSAGGGACR